MMLAFNIEDRQYFELLPPPVRVSSLEISLVKINGKGEAMKNISTFLSLTASVRFSCCVPDVLGNSRPFRRYSKTETSQRRSRNEYNPVQHQDELRFDRTLPL